MHMSGPPAFAWDWLARQRLPWREVRTRLLADGDATVRERYAASDARHDVVALLRADYPDDERIRATVDAVVTELVFLGRADVPLSERGVSTPPRGLLWWSEHLGPGAASTRDERGPLDRPRATDAAVGAPTPHQLELALDDVLGGYGDAPALGTAAPGRPTSGSEPERAEDVA
jgi:hypothetical protein